MIIIIIVTIIIIIIIIIGASRAQPPAKLGGKPASMIYMDGNVQLIITITNAYPPYSSASGGTFCFCSHYYFEPLGSQAALSPARHGL